MKSVIFSCRENTLHDEGITFVVVCTATSWSRPAYRPNAASRAQDSDAWTRTESRTYRDTLETNNQISNGFLFHENIRVNLLKCCYVSCYSFSLQLTQVSFSKFVITFSYIICVAKILFRDLEKKKKKNSHNFNTFLKIA